MDPLAIRRIVVVGGGTAGWMAAAALSHMLTGVEIDLVESEAIGTVGVGEATIPHILYFNRLLGIDEAEFIRQTGATFKLGIEFVDWGRIGDRYFHPFGTYGQEMEGLHFHHFWYRQTRLGHALPLDRFSIGAQAAAAGRFQRPDQARPGSPLGTLNYAYQFDAGRYARFLRERAEARGVRRSEGRITTVRRAAETGHVEAVVLEDGRALGGDLFIDCSGFRGLLIDQTLAAGFEDWSHWLPCDRAVARACARVDAPMPYTRATAVAAGWRWRIPLQARTGNGFVYCSHYCDDEAALRSLDAALDGEPLSNPNVLRFKAGLRRKAWDRNVVALGLAAGFLEPLESTSIHLIQSGIARLLTNFPDRCFNQHDIDYYNRRTRIEYEQVRDFIILHYAATTRDDSSLWRHCRTMALPASLAERIAIFRENGRLYRHDNELFSETSWLAVLHGQGIAPKRQHPLAHQLPEQELDRRMAHIARAMDLTVERMPSHQDILDTIAGG
ncbi:tryptophan halogenase family protein [Sphingomonas kyungheensis]|uniref:Tryptophan halogenase family protein n=1 Tax=Sphingomonas kyungheensis TaxID=1069987 RepID=A0ABU8H6A2_9SPHN